MSQKMYRDGWRETRKRCYYDAGCCTSTRREGSDGSLSRQPSAGPHRPTDRVGDRPPEGRLAGPDIFGAVSFQRSAFSFLCGIVIRHKLAIGARWMAAAGASFVTARRADG